MRRACAGIIGLVMAAAMLPGPAMAKVDNSLFLNPSETTAATKVSLAKQDHNAPVTLSADAMAADQEHNIIVAQGHVEVMQGDSILTADQITYYQQKDLVVATGNVSMLQPSGDVYFADKAELKNQMKQAVIQKFQARFTDDSVLVANRAVKVSSAVTKLKQASYTPCHLCEDMAPLWQMNAGDATVDDLAERVTYHNATMDIFGYPILYLPYLSHPTPNANGKSGFLSPSYSTSPYFGSVAKIPFYWRIGEDKDVVLTPWLTTDEGPLLHWDYRQLRDAGSYHIQGSATNPHAIDSNGNSTDGHEFRGHIFAQGDEEIADNTHVGFDIERASDDTYLRRYGYGDQQSLFSTAYLEQAQGRSFGLLQGVSIQGLRATDNARTTPLVLPILQGYYETPADAHGIKYHIAGDAQILSRDEGVDQRRLSITPGASVPFLTDDGQLFTATVNLRSDLYSGDNIPLGTSGSTESATNVRMLPQAALEWRYPLLNSFDHGSWVLEPVMLGVLQPDSGNRATIINEDSKLIELSDTNLFSIDRMPGLDLIDTGSRLAYGFRTQYYADDGVTYDGLLGQNYDFNSETPFPNSTSPGQQFSDYIGRVGATYDPVSIAYRFAIDKETGTFNRNEVTFNFTKPWLSLSGSYRTIKNNQYINDSREGIVGATLPITDAWSIYGAARRDLELEQMVSASGGIIYKNECFNIIFDAVRTYTRDRDIEPTSEFTVRVGFKNLGEFGGK